MNKRIALAVGLVVILFASFLFVSASLANNKEQEDVLGKGAESIVACGDACNEESFCRGACGGSCGVVGCGCGR